VLGNPNYPKALGSTNQSAKQWWTAPRRLQRPLLLRPPKSPRAPPPVPPSPASLHSRGGEGPGCRLTVSAWAGGGGACPGGPPRSRSMHRINDGLRPYRSQESTALLAAADARRRGALRPPDGATLPRLRSRGTLSHDPARRRWAIDGSLAARQFPRREVARLKRNILNLVLMACRRRRGRPFAAERHILARM
jgi:hypothetical protein